MRPPMVAALTSTNSSLLVSLRRGVGILTFFAINYLRRGRAFVLVQQALKFAQAGLDLAGPAGVAVHRVEGFQTIASNAEHDRIFGRDFARGNEFFGDADG